MRYCRAQLQPQLDWVGFYSRTTPPPSKNIPELQITQTNKRQPQLVLILQENSQPFPNVLKLHIHKMKRLDFQDLLSLTLFYLQNLIYIANNILQSSSRNLSSNPKSFTKVVFKTNIFVYFSGKKNKIKMTIHLRYIAKKYLQVQSMINENTF